jgi:hypothetical protein
MELEIGSRIVTVTHEDKIVHELRNLIRRKETLQI